MEPMIRILGEHIERNVIDALPCRASVAEDCPATRRSSNRKSRAEPRNNGRPTNALPEGVTFQCDTDAHGRATATFFMNEKQVGSADIRDLGLAIQITNFQIARGARRKGIGTAFQFYIEAKLGKPAVPDGMLSYAEYRRWKKVDPVAVSDYVKGAKTYTPRLRSDGHLAAQYGRPVPGSRAAQAIIGLTECRRAGKPPTVPRRKPRREVDESCRNEAGNKIR
jgi:hypothetical protein